MSKEFINYTSRSPKITETISVFEDKVVYEKKEDEKVISITLEDKFFASSMIIGNAYYPLEKEILAKYNEVKQLPNQQLTRPKNSAHKDIEINIDDTNIRADMYIIEYGDVFEKLVSLIKHMIFSEINRQNQK